MRSVILCLFIFFPVMIFAQARIVLNNNAYLVMNNSVYLVVDNANTNAVSTTGSGGNIISENEFNFVKWNIGTTTGNYVIPFTTASSIKIPFSLNITSAATGSGHFLFSTYGGPTWDNNNYKPTGVTNMTNMGGINNSSEVIDRFWIIDALGFTTKPSGNIQFNYNDAEHLTVGNTISETQLKAERYDEVSDNWELYAPGGTVNTVLNSVSGVPFSPADLTRTWTLIDQTSHLLPIELNFITGDCIGENAVVTWQTAQELNTSYFIIEESYDGIIYTVAGVISAAGNTTTATDYIFTIGNRATTYYKISLINDDDSKELIGVFNLNCSNNTIKKVDVFVSGDQQITMNLSGLEKGEYTVQLYDVSGRLLLRVPIFLHSNSNQCILPTGQVASGIYLITISSDHTDDSFFYSEKILLMD